MEFFDLFLNTANIVGTLGVEFDPSGKSYFRLIAFNTLENIIDAMNRISKLPI